MNPETGSEAVYGKFIMVAEIIHGPLRGKPLAIKQIHPSGLKIVAINGSSDMFQKPLTPLSNRHRGKVLGYFSGEVLWNGFKIIS